MIQTKFRFYTGNKMYETGMIDFQDNLVYMKNYKLYTASSFPLNEVELMQFTGLKDKNGKEIYEGDIIKHDAFWEGDNKYPGGIGQIMWDEEDTGFYLTAKDTSYIDLFNLTRNLDAEVIGNIYENPDLLEK